MFSGSPTISNAWTPEDFIFCTKPRQPVSPIGLYCSSNTTVMPSFLAISTIWAWMVEGPSRLTHRIPNFLASGNLPPSHR